jgi:hypothetical protein
MKKLVKIMLAVIMLLGISFSVFNFFSVDAEAIGLKGEWEDLGGVEECMGEGNECTINLNLPGD